MTDIQKIILLVWGTNEATDLVTQALREALAERALEICHETGDPESFITFCAETVARFMKGEE